MKIVLTSSITFLLLLTTLLVNAPRAWADNSDWVQVQRFERLLAKAREGKVSAMYEVGRKYELGRGVNADFTKAAEWYQKAASAGNAPAKARLGILYFEGRGVPQDHQQAYRLLKDAAEANIPAAQYQLGLMYEWGTVVSQNREEALNWYTRAGANGDYRAKNKIRQLKTAAKKQARPKTTNRTATQAPTKKADTISAANPAGTANEILATILQGQWSKRKQAAAILPSTASECSVKDSQIHCRGKQERSTGTEIIVYESESVLSDFKKTRFKISYTNTVLEVKPTEPTAGPLSDTNTAPVAGNIKPGQKTRPHILDCELIKGKRIRCSRDKTTHITFNLTS